jgi:hypothetical protein
MRLPSITTVALSTGFTVPAAVDRVEVDQVGMGLGVAGRSLICTNSNSGQSQDARSASDRYGQTH